MCTDRLATSVAIKIDRSFALNLCKAPSLLLCLIKHNGNITIDVGNNDNKLTY